MVKPLTLYRDVVPRTHPEKGTGRPRSGEFHSRTNWVPPGRLTVLLPPGTPASVYGARVSE